METQKKARKARSQSIEDRAAYVGRKMAEVSNYTDIVYRFNDSKIDCWGLQGSIRYGLRMWVRKEGLQVKVSNFRIIGTFYYSDKNPADPEMVMLLVSNNDNPRCESREENLVCFAMGTSALSKLDQDAINDGITTLFQSDSQLARENLEIRIHDIENLMSDGYIAPNNPVSLRGRDVSDFIEKLLIFTKLMYKSDFVVGKKKCITPKVTSQNLKITNLPPMTEDNVDDIVKVLTEKFSSLNIFNGKLFSNLDVYKCHLGPSDIKCRNFDVEYSKTLANSFLGYSSLAFVKKVMFLVPMNWDDESGKTVKDYYGLPLSAKPREEDISSCSFWVLGGQHTIAAYKLLLENDNTPIEIKNKIRTVEGVIFWGPQSTSTNLLMMELSLALNEHQKVKLDDTQFLVVADQVRDIWVRSGRPHHHKDKGTTEFNNFCRSAKIAMPWARKDKDSLATVNAPGSKVAVPNVKLRELSPFIYEMSDDTFSLWMRVYERSNMGGLLHSAGKLQREVVTKEGGSWNIQRYTVRGLQGLPDYYLNKIATYLLEKTKLQLYRDKQKKLESAGGSTKKDQFIYIDDYCTSKKVSKQFKMHALHRIKGDFMEDLKNVEYPTLKKRYTDFLAEFNLDKEKVATLFDSVSDYIRRGIIRGTTKEEIPKEFLNRCEMYKSAHSGQVEVNSNKATSANEIFKSYKMADNSQNSLSCCSAKRRKLQEKCSVVILDNILLSGDWTATEWDNVVHSLSSLGKPRKHTLVFIVAGFQFHQAMCAIVGHSKNYIIYTTAYSGASTNAGEDFKNSSRAHVIYAFNLPETSLKNEQTILDKLNERRNGQKLQDICEHWTTLSDKRRCVELGNYLASMFAVHRSCCVICPGNFNLISSFLEKKVQTNVFCLESEIEQITQRSDSLLFGLGYRKEEKREVPVSPRRSQINSTVLSLESEGVSTTKAEEVLTSILKYQLSISNVSRIDDILMDYGLDKLTSSWDQFCPPKPLPTRSIQITKRKRPDEDNDEDEDMDEDLDESHDGEGSGGHNIDKGEDGDEDGNGGQNNIDSDDGNGNEEEGGFGNEGDGGSGGDEGNGHGSNNDEIVPLNAQLPLFKTSPPQTHSSPLPLTHNIIPSQHFLTPLSNNLPLHQYLAISTPPAIPIAIPPLLANTLPIPSPTPNPLYNSTLLGDPMALANASTSNPCSFVCATPLAFSQSAIDIQRSSGLNEVTKSTTFTDMLLRFDPKLPTTFSDNACGLISTEITSTKSKGLLKRLSPSSEKAHLEPLAIEYGSDDDVVIMGESSAKAKVRKRIEEDEQAAPNLPLQSIGSSATGINLDDLQKFADDFARRKELSAPLPQIGKDIEKSAKRPRLTIKKSNVLQGKKLLIFDLNGVLSTSFYPGSRISQMDIIEEIKIPPPASNGKYILLRPGLKEFLNFCFENFDVAVWSCATRKNVVASLSVIMTQNQIQSLKFIYTQTECTKTNITYIFDRQENKTKKPVYVKTLDRVFSAFPNYSKDSVILIDDSPYKAVSNDLASTLFPPSFDPWKNRSDSFLLDTLKPYLEQVGRMSMITSIPKWSHDSWKEDWHNRSDLYRKLFDLNLLYSGTSALNIRHPYYEKLGGIDTAMSQLRLKRPPERDGLFFFLHEVANKDRMYLTRPPVNPFVYAFSVENFFFKTSSKNISSLPAELIIKKSSSDSTEKVYFNRPVDSFISWLVYSDIRWGIFSKELSRRQIIKILKAALERKFLPAIFRSSCLFTYGAENCVVVNPNKKYKNFHLLRQLDYLPNCEIVSISTEGDYLANLPDFSNAAIQIKWPPFVPKIEDDNYFEPLKALITELTTTVKHPLPSFVDSLNIDKFVNKKHMRSYYSHLWRNPPAPKQHALFTPLWRATLDNEFVCCTKGMDSWTDQNSAGGPNACSAISLLLALWHLQNVSCEIMPWQLDCLIEYGVVAYKFLLNEVQGWKEKYKDGCIDVLDMLEKGFSGALTLVERHDLSVNGSDDKSLAIDPEYDFDVVFDELRPKEVGRETIYVVGDGSHYFVLKLTIGNCYIIDSLGVRLRGFGYSLKFDDDSQVFDVSDRYKVHLLAQGSSALQLFVKLFSSYQQTKQMTFYKLEML